MTRVSKKELLSGRKLMNAFPSIVYTLKLEAEIQTGVAANDQSRSIYRRADHTTSTSYQAGRDGAAYTVYPGDFDRRRGSSPGRRGGRGRYY
jgi:hypothetical protein